MKAIYKRELAAYAHSMTGCVATAFLLAVVGLYFMAYNLYQGTPGFATALNAASFLLILVVPLLTMRSLAEERKNRTDQLLLTAPVSVTGVAGPDRDERDNPVGLVYIGLATPEGTFCRRTDSGRRRRDRIQELAANHALDVVRRYLTGLPIG